jgi:hypothetical protein
MEHDGLMIGMFYGGLIMAIVPVSLGLGVAIYVIKRHFEGDGEGSRNDR